MKAYSLDLQERIVAAVADGMPKALAARTFRVSVATVKVYVARQQRAVSLVPGHSSGRPAYIRSEQYPALRRQLETTPDATLAEHAALWEKSHGVRPSLSALWRTIRRIGWTYKKRAWVPANATQRNAPPFAGS